MSKIKKLQKNVYIIDNIQGKIDENKSDNIVSFKENSLFFNMLTINWPNPKTTNEKEEMYKKAVYEEIDRLILVHNKNNIFWGKVMLDSIPDLDNINDTIRKKILVEIMGYPLYISRKNNILNNKVYKTSLCNSLEGKKGIVEIPMKTVHILHVIKVF